VRCAIPVNAVRVSATAYLPCDTRGF